MHVRPRLAPGQWHGFLRPAAKPPVVGGDLGRGRRTSPSSAAPLSPKPADGPRTAAFGLVGFSVFVVRLFSSPSVCPSWGKGPPSTPPPKPWSGPAVSDRPARQPRSRGATKTPAAPTAQGVQPRPPTSSRLDLLTCQQLLQALAEGLQLSLARKPLGAEELGDEGHGGGNLAYHGGGPGVKGMHGGGRRERPGAAGARRRGPDGGAATPGSLHRSED